MIIREIKQLYAHTGADHQALADALEWFEKELGWGVPPASLPHLTGRIGELYVAVQTRGQMARKTNQAGYDVVSANGDRISVKTITSSTHVTFNPNSFTKVDRVIILRINVDETEPSIEEILDCSATETLKKGRQQGGKMHISVSGSTRQPQDLSKLAVTAAGRHGNIEIRQYENGSIALSEGGVDVSIVKPVLRRIAQEIGVSLLNGSGNPKNTRTLGNDVINALGERDTVVAASRTAPRSGAGAMEKDALALSMEACLLGGAIGDALGAEMEFWSLDEIRRSYPDGIADLPPHDNLRGAITDDTQMTLFTVEGLIRAMVRQASKGICHMPSVVHHALLRWLKTQGETSPALTRAYNHGGEWAGLVLEPRLQKRRAPGLTCLKALSSAKAFGDAATNDSKGCGTIMRVAPLGFIQPDLIRRFAEECSALTHGHATGQQAAAAWALILQGVLTGQSIVQAAERQLGTFNHEVERALQRALAAPRDGLSETVATLGEGWVAEEALSIALYACLASNDLEGGLLTAVLHDGDSDSTGAIAGNALGLIYPDQVFTHRWAEQVECRDLIFQLAQDFAEASVGDAEELFERYPGW